MTFKVDGLKDLEKALSELGSRAGKKALLGALRDAAKPIRKKMRAMAPKITGNLRKHIQTKAVSGKGQTNNVATVMIGTFRAPRWNPGYYIRFLEFGIKPHKMSFSAYNKGKTKKKKMSFGGKVFSSVNHPGQRATPIIGPAFDQTHKQATKILAKRLRERIILEAIKKHGRNFS